VKLSEQCASSCFDTGYVARLRNREAETEAHFVAYFRLPICLKARRRLRAPDLVADACQETLLRVLQYLRSGKLLDYPERLPAFVNSVCHNVTLEMIRSQNRYGQMAPDEQEPASAWEDPELQLITEERKQLVREILAQLSEKDRDLLGQAFLREMDKAELCRRFGVNEAYLRVLLHRARIHFRDALLKGSGATLSEQKSEMFGDRPARTRHQPVSSIQTVTPSTSSPKSAEAVA
jgi:RNA polymerase sigma factor (sigma-70 family)